jgi:hypothetical protein
VLTRPVGLSDHTVERVAAERWGLTVASIEFRPVGFGSYHWELSDGQGTRWFLTVDDLAAKRHARSETSDAAFSRIGAALATAADLRDAGCGFVVAPIPTSAGPPLVRVDRRFAVALYPYIDGESYPWGEFSTQAHRRSVLDMVVALHNVPATATPHALADDFDIPCRDELESSLDGSAHETGPYTQPTSALVIDHAERIRTVLARYDNLVALVNQRSPAPRRAVLTHGEPHPANTMLSADGWWLIDWDSALRAPPERDLWSLDPGDGSIYGAYADATGTTPLTSALNLYRIRWDLGDIAAYVTRFRHQHTGSQDDDKSWDDLRALVARLPG